MPEQEHTPGPWEVKPVEKDGDYLRIRGTCLGGVYTIANVPVFENVSDPEVMANANLIAAAPEMLEALKMILDDVFGYLAIDLATREFAEMAIAKAEGREQ